MKLKYSIFTALFLSIWSYSFAQDFKYQEKKGRKVFPDQQIPLLDTVKRLQVYPVNPDEVKNRKGEILTVKLYGKDSAPMPGTKKLDELDQLPLKEAYNFRPLLLKKDSVLKK
ncbi:hypothetical protein ACFU8T_01815 [Sphingobacterium spiritivorum]|uniref:Uncharacterized protein n=1 Tax=Sphingobacterium spiritivorum ATCC 33861 TaxID=525373 RepID=D7VHL0_SPHSI|nr:hypothetical protein [Sphingobacterium spiritivorum]EFK59562.1 hypothetical protein HMPREF0766_10479 [Sphingobacterium spiritivorum ATCC 33861]QQT37771.1 hypothetical protein I6J01_10355 [Sphingobacterium spiritivorum]WQD34581.1 hypothetical protein U0038_02285 [Sphingobacterium spiritivorum]SUI97573.1 Uncharacterised protein [Sphingobacterium spiritivorum]